MSVTPVLIDFVPEGSYNFLWMLALSTMPQKKVSLEPQKHLKKKKENRDSLEGLAFIFHWKRTTLSLGDLIRQ